MFKIFSLIKLKVVAGVAIGALLVAVNPIPVEAGPGLPFGGQVLYIIPCACSGNVLIVNRPIGPNSVPNLIFGPTSIPYAFYSHFIPGSFILGTYTHVEPCVVWVGVCAPYPQFPVGFKIFMVGSSLPGV